MEHRGKGCWGPILSVLLLGIVLSVGFPARADVQTSAKSKKEPPAQKEKCTDLSSVKVIAVNNSDVAAEYTDRAGLGEDLLVTVECLPRLLKEKAEKSQNIVLFLNGMPIAGGYPPAADTSKNMLRFRLERTEESHRTWDTLLGRPNHYIRPIAVSVGLEKADAPVATAIDNGNRFKLVNIRKTGLTLWGFFALLSLVIMIYLARKTAMLRVYGPQSPYSLAYVQMAFWTYLAVVAYVFLWFINGAIPEVTASVLSLLGIGSGTALGARLIDGTKLKDRLSQLHEDKEKCGQELAKLASPKDDALIKSLTDKLKKISEEITNALDARNTPSDNILIDILKDKDGVALHRFQIVIWTIVLGVIFVKEVYASIGMPEFSETMLILIGISSGAYLGFKFPEEHAYGSKKEVDPVTQKVK